MSEFSAYYMGIWLIMKYHIVCTEVTWYWSVYLSFFTIPTFPQAADHSMLKQVVDYEEQKKLVMDRISIWQAMQVSKINKVTINMEFNMVKSFNLLLINSFILVLY